MAWRLLRAGKWILFVFGALAALVPVALVIYGHWAEARVDKVVGDLRAEEDPVALSDLVKPPISAADNAAAVYERAFDAIELSEQDGKLVRSLLNGQLRLSGPAIGAQARDILHRNAGALKLIHKAGNMPRCRFELDWTQGFDLNFPHRAKFRRCAWLLALESLSLSSSGRVDQAVAAYRANLQLTRNWDEPALVSQLVRWNIIAIGSQALGTVLAVSQPSERACGTAAEEILRIDLTSSDVVALEAERAGGLAFIRQASDPVRFARAMEPSSGKPDTGGEPAVRPPRVAPPLWKWWLSEEQLSYLYFMDRVIREAGLPYREAISIHPSIEQELKTRHRFRFRPPPVFSAILVPVPLAGQKLRDRAIAHLGLDQIALLLKAYKAARGAYPETLQELENYAGGALSEDPFSGKRFVYRREGEGFLLYSWGPNLKDDGGTPPPPEQRDEGDIIFRCVR